MEVCDVEKLYKISFPLDKSRSRLYFQGEDCVQRDGVVAVPLHSCADFGTYFNAFSLKKWLQYTTLKKLMIHLELKGKFRIVYYGINETGSLEVSNYEEEGSVDKTFDAAELTAMGIELLGFRITALTSECEILGGEYCGQFTESRDVNIGITICTFHREEYLLKNLSKLEMLCRENPSFHVMVIDNGSSLEERREDWLQILHNPNYGGSGGFTRGLMEQVTQGKSTHVILMDDDILLELSSLDRVYALLKHLKPERQNQMLAGAMLDMNRPEIQYENTAYWGIVRLRALGRNLDLTHRENLIFNEHLGGQKNRYAAWWFCCIPIEVIIQNGYPLPVFIKSDDMEYGIRNHQDIITMNGIGVWHEAFGKKESAAINYYNDRNMMILNCFLPNGNRVKFLLMLLARLTRRVLNRDSKGIRFFEKALRDYALGMEKITVVGSDEQFATICNYENPHGVIVAFINCLGLCVREFFCYGTRRKTYLEFRRDKLQTLDFWQRFLKLKEG